MIDLLFELQKYLFTSSSSLLYHSYQPELLSSLALYPSSPIRI